MLWATMSISLYAQDITGTWNGALVMGKAQLRIVFHIEKTDTGYIATMDSPDQGAKGIEVTSVEYQHSDTFKLIVKPLRIEYVGRIVSDSLIKGTFRQAGMELPMDLSRMEIAPKSVARKQDPKKPYPYQEQEVKFHNPDAGIDLAGTVTIPEGDGPFPAVVLVSGSGSQDRNEELLGHRPFLVLSDYLTRKGVLVLRYDDRGVGGSGGSAENATTADLAGDALAAVNYLMSHPMARKDRIGVMGHSEGGVIAPMVANRIPAVKFIVLLAGPGVPCDELLLKQIELISRAGGMKEDELEKSMAISREVFRLIKEEKDTAILRSRLAEYLWTTTDRMQEEMKKAGMTEKDYVESQVSAFMSPWMLYFLNYDPAVELAQVKCHVLAVNGSLDLQVSAPENPEGIRKVLEKGGNRHYTIKTYPKLNHLFQKCKTGHPNEYGDIKQTFSPKVMKDVSRWILKV